MWCYDISLRHPGLAQVGFVSLEDANLCCAILQGNGPLRLSQAFRQLVWGKSGAPPPLDTWPKQAHELLQRNLGIVTEALLEGCFEDAQQALDGLMKSSFSSALLEVRFHTLPEADSLYLSQSRVRWKSPPPSLMVPAR